MIRNRCLEMEEEQFERGRNFDFVVRVENTLVRIV